MVITDDLLGSLFYSGVVRPFPNRAHQYGAIMRQSHKRDDVGGGPAQPSSFERRQMALARIPRGVKVALALVALSVLIVVVLISVLIVVLLVTLIGGGSLPGIVQGINDFAQTNLKPVLDLWNSLQGLTGG